MPLLTMVKRIWTCSKPYCSKKFEHRQNIFELADGIGMWPNWKYPPRLSHIYLVWWRWISQIRTFFWSNGQSWRSANYWTIFRLLKTTRRGFFSKKEILSGFFQLICSWHHGHFCFFNLIFIEQRGTSRLWIGSFKCDCLCFWFRTDNVTLSLQGFCLTRIWKFRCKTTKLLLFYPRIFRLIWSEFFSRTRLPRISIRILVSSLSIHQFRWLLHFSRVRWPQNSYDILQWFWSEFGNWTTELSIFGLYLASKGT